MTTPEEDWQGFRAKVYDKGIKPDQEKECASCFYAGMHAAYFSIMEICAMPEDKAMRELEKYSKSIQVAALSQNPTGSN